VEMVETVETLLWVAVVDVVLMEDAVGMVATS
jgi:hypothetical protein